ncbi:MAG: alcohol dehydrogenase catalytic domain-containing protein [Planctomycetes bacterium]|nr:alcohol dehydrogenase catalytic domain-containing protein [Planctomycetota bacterium]
MKGLWIESGSVQLRDDLPQPEPTAGATRVLVTCAGVCATDLALRRGYMGFTGVPGHEFVGVAIDGPRAGQRVVGDINVGCGDCRSCREEHGHHCPDRTVLGIVKRAGAFAEEILLPDRNLIYVPDHVPDDVAVFTEPLAAALQIVEQVPMTGQRALVAGDGRLGLLIAKVLALAGCEVTCAGRHPERAELLPNGTRHATGVLESTPTDRTYDLAVEATGDPNALARLVGHVRPRGTIVLKTTAERPATLDLAPLVIDEITVVGSRCGPFDRALHALAAGAIDPRPMIEARYPLSDAVQALDHAGRGGVLKVLIDG